MSGPHSGRLQRRFKHSTDTPSNHKRPLPTTLMLWTLLLDTLSSEPSTPLGRMVYQRITKGKKNFRGSRQRSSRPPGNCNHLKPKVQSLPDVVHTPLAPSSGTSNGDGKRRKRSIEEELVPKSKKQRLTDGARAPTAGLQEGTQVLSLGPDGNGDQGNRVNEDEPED